MVLAVRVGVPGHRGAQAAQQQAVVAQALQRLQQEGVERQVADLLQLEVAAQRLQPPQAPAGRLQLRQDLVQTFRNAHVLNKPQCTDCWARFYCSGGCHANADQFHGDIHKPYEIGCELQKKRRECAIMIQAVLLMAKAQQ